MANGNGKRRAGCHLFTLNLKSHIKAIANFLKDKSSAKYRWPFIFLQSLFHTVKEWKSLARVSLKCRFSLCEARAKLKWNLKVDSPAVTLAYSSKSPINFAKISLQFIERKSLYILPINLDMEVQFVHWPWLFPNPFSHFLHCVTQLKLETLDKLSSSIFCCLWVCRASVTPSQISTFFNVYTV